MHQRLIVQNQQTDKQTPVNRHKRWLYHAIYTFHSIVAVQLYIAAIDEIVMVKIKFGALFYIICYNRKKSVVEHCNEDIYRLTLPN